MHDGHQHHRIGDEPRQRHGRIPRIGIGGPVGSGKTALIEALIPRLIARGYTPLVITNDIVTREDTEHVRRTLTGASLTWARSTRQGRGRLRRAPAHFTTRWRLARTLLEARPADARLALHACQQRR